MNRCCDSLGRCTQGANCPARATPLPDSFPQPTALEHTPSRSHRLAYAALLVGLAGLSAGIAWGAGNYFLDTFGPAIARAFWTVATRWF